MTFALTFSVDEERRIFALMHNFIRPFLAFGAFLFAFVITVAAQYPGWQMAADYDMTIVVDVDAHQYEGEMTCVWTNNSPDDLDRAFFHLFFNAFQPGSMMDVRSRTIADPDPRVGDRISLLPDSEWGWQDIESVQLNGKEAAFTIDGTILDVALPSVVKKGKKATFKMKWRAQVPRQIRRSGWMNTEGIEYSMTQWYPKLCEYDHDGWHTDPYVGREFHGIWADYKVKISMPQDYVIGGTGESQGPVQEGDRAVWQFSAEDVIDFAWAADPDYLHKDTLVGATTLNFYHQADTAYDAAWAELPAYTAKAFNFLQELVGPYPYPQYSVIQGGDGGMEYPMATLITGNRSLRSLVGVTVHEMAHSWFQALIATNESLYEFLDEGFTSYATSLCMDHLFADAMGAPHRYSYGGYINQAKSGNEEPLITHADHYMTNRAYGIAAYSKGEVMLAQLAGVMGSDLRDAGLKTYFAEWSFKHPGINDFKRVMEKTSNLELDWYFQYFVNTTQTIDYAISGLENDGDTIDISLERLGKMPMPVDVQVIFEDDSQANYHIPLVVMRGHRPLDADETLAADWAWVNPNYTLSIPAEGKKVRRVEIDPDRHLADVDRDNNSAEFCTSCVQSLQR